MFIYCLTYALLKNFLLSEDITMAGEGLQNLGSALKAFEQEEIFVVTHLLWHGTSVFPVSSEGPPQSIASYDTNGDAEGLQMIWNKPFSIKHCDNF